MQPDPDPVLPAEAEFDHCMTLVEDGLVRRDDALQVVGMDALFPPALRIARPDLRVRISGQGMDVLGEPRGAEPAGSEAERVDDRRTACKEARRSLLCSLALGDVFDDADRAHGRARVVPEDDHVHVCLLYTSPSPRD